MLSLVRLPIAALALLAACSTVVTTVAAQSPAADTSIDAGRLWLPLGPGDFATVRGSAVPPHLQFFGAAFLTYQHRPVVLSQPEMGEAEAVTTQLDAHFLFALGLFDQLQLGAALPLRLIQSGTGVAPILGEEPRNEIDVIRAGDLRIGADWRPVELTLGDGRVFGLLISAALVTPTGNRGRFTTSDTWVFVPGVSTDLTDGDLAFAVEVGARIPAETRAIGAARFGSSLVARGGIAWFPVDDPVSLSLEGGAIFELAEQSPEATQEQHVYDVGVGLRWTPGLDYTVRSAFSLAAGGFGAPAFRFVLGVEYGARPVTPLRRR